MFNFLKSKPQFVCFAPIDLKKADIYIRDGFDNVANTPLTSAIEPIGESVIALTGMATAVPDPAVTTGVSVKFGSDTTEYTVTSRTLGSGTNEVQTIEIDDDVSGGTFTLSYGGQTTGALAYNSSAAIIEAALEALSTLGLGTATVTGASPTWTVTFTGTMASTNATIISGDGLLLTGGDATTVTVTETLAGVDAVAEIQTMTATTALTNGTYTLTFDGETTPAIPWDADEVAVEAYLESLDGIAVGEATVATGVGSWPELNATLTITFSGGLAGDVALITDDDALTDGVIVISESTPGVPGVAEINTIRINDSVSGGTFTLTQGGNTTAPILYSATAADVQAALVAAPTSLGVVVTGGPGPATDWVVTYSATGVQTDMTGTGTNLTGGVATTVNVTEITAGSSGAETTTITVTPVLVAATTVSGSVTFGGRKLEIKVGEGNVSFTENTPREYLLNRGILDTVRDADEVPMDVSFDFVWEFLSAVGSSAIPTIKEVLKQTGEASTWLSTSDDACEPYCCDIEINYDPGCGGANTELIELKYFRPESLEHNISDAQISCTGKCNVTEAVETRGS